jgi:hypothetical protein
MDDTEKEPPTKRLADIEGERDRLQDELSKEMNIGQSMEGQCHDLEVERDALAQVLANMAECAHDANIAEPMCACPCHLPDGAVAERDRLRVIVEQAHDHVAVDENVLRTLAADDLVAIVAVLRRDYADARGGYAKATAAADAAAAAVGNMAEYVSKAVAERDRLRTEVAEAASERKGLRVALTAANDEADAMRTERDRLRDALAEVYFHLGPPQDRVAEHTQVPRLVEQAMAERDRLRAAARDLLAVIDNAEPDGAVWRLSGSRWVSALRGALGPEVADG